MRSSAGWLTVLVLTLVSGSAISPQNRAIADDGRPVVDPGPQAPATGDPIDEDPTAPNADGPDGRPPDPIMPGDEPGDEPDGDQDEQPMPGENPGEDGADASLAGEWLLDFPNDGTPWQSDGTTFSSETCTWSGVVPILPNVSLIAGPIECSDGILPTFGLGIASDGEMSAVAIRLLWFFPFVTCFEGEQVPQGPPDQDPQAPAGPQAPQEPPDQDETPDPPDEATDGLIPQDGATGPPINRTFDRSRT